MISLHAACFLQPALSLAVGEARLSGLHNADAWLSQLAGSISGSEKGSIDHIERLRAKWWIVSCSIFRDACSRLASIRDS